MIHADKNYNLNNNLISILPFISVENAFLFSSFITVNSLCNAERKKSTHFDYYFINLQTKIAQAEIQKKIQIVIHLSPTNNKGGCQVHLMITTYTLFCQITYRLSFIKFFQLLDIHTLNNMTHIFPINCINEFEITNYIFGVMVRKAFNGLSFIRKTQTQTRQNVSPLQLYSPVFLGDNLKFSLFVPIDLSRKIYCIKC